MELAVYVTFILEVILLLIAAVCNVTEAIKPETKALTKVSPFLLLATFATFPVIIWFFNMFFDIAIIWDIMKGIPTVFLESIKMFTGCYYI